MAQTILQIKLSETIDLEESLIDRINYILSDIIICSLKTSVSTLGL